MSTNDKTLGSVGHRCIASGDKRACGSAVPVQPYRGPAARTLNELLHAAMLKTQPAVTRSALCTGSALEEFRRSVNDRPFSIACNAPSDAAPRQWSPRRNYAASPVSRRCASLPHSSSPQHDRPTLHRPRRPLDRGCDSRACRLRTAIPNQGVAGTGGNGRRRSSSGGIQGPQFRGRRPEDRRARIKGPVFGFTDVRPPSDGELQPLQGVGSRVGRRVRKGGETRPAGSVLPWGRSGMRRYLPGCAEPCAVSGKGQRRRSRRNGSVSSCESASHRRDRWGVAHRRLFLSVCRRRHRCDRRCPNPPREEPVAR